MFLVGRKGGAPSWAGGTEAKQQGDGGFVLGQKQQGTEQSSKTWNCFAFAVFESWSFPGRRRPLIPTRQSTTY
jgi:hypothetical protein